MKKFLLFPLLLILMFLLAACGVDDSNATAEPEKGEAKTAVTKVDSNDDFDWPKSWIGATQGTGSSSQGQMLAWANELELASGMKIRSVPENSNPVKLNGVKSGQFDSHFSSLGEVIYGMEATFGYESKDGGPAPVAGMWHDSAQAFGIMVRGDSKLNTVNDIKKGTKIAHWTGPGGLDPINAILAWADVPFEDVILVETSDYADQSKMIADGRADVTVLVVPAAAAVTEASATPNGIRFLDLNPEKDPEGAKRFNSVMPAQFFLQLKGGPDGTTDGVYGWGTSGWYWVHEDKDPDVVYNMVKWMNENYDKLKGLHPEFDPNLSLEAVRKTLDSTYMPIHEGTIRYLKEVDQWTEADEIRQEYNTKLAHKYIDEYQNAIKEAENKGIKVDASNKEWVKFWQDYKDEMKIPQFAILSDEEVKESLATNF